MRSVVPASIERKNTGYDPGMERDQTPLSSEEAEVMGRQSERDVRGEPLRRQTVYGDIEGSVDNEDQADAHHAEPGEHV